MHSPVLFTSVFISAILLIISFALFARQRRLIDKAPPAAMLRTASLHTPEIDEKRWWFGLLSTLLLLAVTAMLLKLYWPMIPQRFPIHWAFNGQPNRWASRSFSSVFGPLILTFAIVASLGALGELIGRSSPGHEGRAAIIRTARTILIASSWFITILICAISLLPLAPNPTSLVPFLVITATVFTVGVAGYTALRIFRMKRIVVASRNSTEGRYWKAGLFYFNPGDSALMVPKRIGFGYTLNFGRPVSWLIFALILLVPLTLPLMLRVFQ